MSSNKIISKIQLPNLSEPYLLRDTETNQGLNTHKENYNIHITSEERDKWDSFEVPVTSTPSDNINIWIDPNEGNNIDGPSDEVVLKSGTTMTGALIAASGDIAVAQVRNIYAGTVDLEAGVSELPAGTIYLVYE